MQLTPLRRRPGSLLRVLHMLDSPQLWHAVTARRRSLANSFVSANCEGAVTVLPRALAWHPMFSVICQLLNVSWVLGYPSTRQKEKELEESSLDGE